MRRRWRSFCARRAIRRTRSASGTTRPSTTSRRPATARRGRCSAASTASTASSAAKRITSRRRSWSRTTRSSIATRYPGDYYCTDDLTDKAIGWLTAHACVVAGQAVLPLPAVQRAARAAACEARPISRATQARTTPAGTRARSAPRHGSARWACIARDIRRAAAQPRRARVGRRRRRRAARCYARYMELYAAIVDNIDQNIGRLIDTLDAARSPRQHAGHRDVGQRRQRHRRRRRCRNNLVEAARRDAEDPAWVRAMLDERRLGGAGLVARVSARLDRRVAARRSGCTRRRR